MVNLQKKKIEITKNLELFIEDTNLNINNIIYHNLDYNIYHLFTRDFIILNTSKNPADLYSFSDVSPIRDMYITRHIARHTKTDICVNIREGTVDFTSFRNSSAAVVSGVHKIHPRRRPLGTPSFDSVDSLENVPRNGDNKNQVAMKGMELPNVPITSTLSPKYDRVTAADVTSADISVIARTFLVVTSDQLFLLRIDSSTSLCPDQSVSLTDRCTIFSSSSSSSSDRPAALIISSASIVSFRMNASLSTSEGDSLDSSTSID